MDDEEEVHGDEAAERWHELSRGLWYAVAGFLAYLAAAYLWWNATGAELTSAAAGLTLIVWAIFLFRRGLIAFSYNSETSNGTTTRTLTTKQLPISPPIAVSVSIGVGVVLLIPSTPAPGANSLTGVTTGMLTVKDAGMNLWGIPGALIGTILAPIVLLIFVGVGFAMTFAPVAGLYRVITGRGHFETDDFVLVPIGLFMLGFVALCIWVTITYWDDGWGDYLRPFREIGGWFT